MDEMGIADKSKNNSLKVLHPELDENYENEENKKIAFVGISNHPLDPSKMNRMYVKTIGKQNKNDIIETAKEIAGLEIIRTKFYENIIQKISESYYNYQNNNQGEDFHGQRDFYFLIKYIFNNNHINKINENNLDLVFDGIYRNFGGKDNNEISESFKNYMREFIDRYNKNFNYNIIKCINDNIESEIDSRYLLLIIKDKFGENILKTILKEKKYVIISKEDFDNNENIDIIGLLLKIQIYMEQEIILILKNLDIIYPSLYELFNKSFTKYLGDKKYTRISNENRQTLVYVNDKFRVIILLEEKKLKEADKPFLNRFEKHKLNFEILLDEEEKNIVKNLYNSFNNFLEEKEISLKNHLIIKNKNIISYLLLFYYDKERPDKFLSKLIPFFTQEMIYLLKFKSINILNNTKKILSLYKENYKNNYNFKTFLSELNEQKRINVIYTFSKRNDINFNNENIFSEKFKIEKTVIKDINYETKKSILEDIKNFNEDNNKNLLILNINNNINEKKEMLLNIFYKVSKIIEEYIKFNESNLNKYYIFIFYIEKYAKQDNKNEIIINEEENNDNTFINIFLNYNQQFIDNLIHKYNQFNIEIFTGSKYEIIEKSIENIIEQVFRRIILNVNAEQNYNLEGINKIKTELKKNKNILDIIKEELKKRYVKISYNIYSKIISGNKAYKKDETFIEKFNKEIIEELVKLLEKIVNYLEEDLILSTALFSPLKDESEKYLKDTLDKFDDKKEYNGIKNICLGFNLPLYISFKTINLNLEEINENDNVEKILKENIYSDYNLINYFKEKGKYLLVYKDYLLYYIINILKEKIKNSNIKELVINFLDKILTKGFIKNYYNENIKNFVKLVVYLRSNLKLMSCVLLLFLDAKDIIPDFINKFELEE